MKMEHARTVADVTLRHAVQTASTQVSNAPSSLRASRLAISLLVLPQTGLSSLREDALSFQTTHQHQIITFPVRTRSAQTMCFCGTLSLPPLSVQTLPRMPSHSI